MIAPALGRTPGRCPSGLDSKYLGAWKGLTYLDAFPHISFTLSFSKEKEMEGKPLVGLLPHCCEEGDGEADMDSPGG